jgi:hypothetical protein
MFFLENKISNKLDNRNCDKDANKFIGRRNVDIVSGIGYHGETPGTTGTIKYGKKKAETARVGSRSEASFRGLSKTNRGG